jgi:hypothetical protein
MPKPHFLFKIETDICVSANNLVEAKAALESLSPGQLEEYGVSTVNGGRQISSRDEVPDDVLEKPAVGSDDASLKDSLAD